MTFDELFNKISAGEITRDEARKHFSLEWMETARNYIADVNRGARINTPEIIYGEYKTADQTIEMAEALLSKHERVLVSRSSSAPEIAAYFKDKYEIRETPNLLAIGTMPEGEGHVLVISAGAADHPVTSECALALEALGVNPLVFEDRGIAHPTRVLDAVMEG
ncbi:MAG: 1-(5-phosphoribosyl)-5-amino-4-imidazole-carboxylate carboxylase, partial [Marinilabiliaceae bacterium]